jgi:hypothetical protein
MAGLTQQRDEAAPDDPAAAGEKHGPRLWTRCGGHDVLAGIVRPF